MSSDSLANYFKKRPNPVPKKPTDRLMELLRKVQSDEPSKLRHMPPDPTATKRPDGDKPDPPSPKPTRKPYPKITM